MDCDEGEMWVDYIDFVKKYHHTNRKISAVIRVVDSRYTPIIMAQVRATIIDPEGNLQSLSKMTNHQGMAVFEFSRSYRGRWEIVIDEISHPCYKYDTVNSLALNRFTNL
ncbi:MAG: hypothetical protein ACFFEF_13710 [Candidatus Thorarchaeota archaeon]